MLLVSGQGFAIDGGGLFAVNGSTVEQIDNVSSGGLAFDGTRLARALKCDPNRKRLLEIVVYDDQGVCRYQRIDTVRDTHDIAWDGENIVAIATWYNSALWFSPGGTLLREVQFPGEKDAWHLNCITNHDGTWYATVFGSFRTFRRWMPPTRTARGQIVELETGRVVARGLSAPHHPKWVDGEWLVCNSEKNEVVAIDDRTGQIVRRADCRGWTRGLAVDADFIYVGASKRQVATPEDPRASVVVVDRRTWEPVDRVAIPAQELYDLALVPDRIVAGVRTGFETNPERASQRRQWALLEELGCPKPRTLWPTGEALRWADFRCEIDGALPSHVVGGEHVDLPLRITNRGRDFLTTAPPAPVYLSYKWLVHETGEYVDDRPAHRTWLPRTIYPNETVEIMARIIAPTRPGPARLRITLIQEGTSWFDDIDPANVLEGDVNVAPEIMHPAGEIAPVVRVFTRTAPVPERELEHIAAAIATSALVAEPLPSRFVENVFSPGTYATMVAYFPSLGSSETVARVDMVRAIDELSPESRAFWATMAQLLSGSAFAKMLLDAFPEQARARFGAILDDESFAETALRSSIFFADIDADDARIVELASPGTTFTFSAEVGTINVSGDGSRTNAARLIAHVRDTLQSTSAADRHRGRRRRRIIVEVIAINERPREACTVSIVAALPRSMPSDSEASIRYRMTNRSNLELTSALPCTTQVGYRWFEGGELTASGSEELPSRLGPGERLEGTLRIKAPKAVGSYRLAVAVVQDGIAWYDDLDAENGFSATVTVDEQDSPTFDDVDLGFPETVKAEVGRDDALVDDIVDGLLTSLDDSWYPVEFENGVPFRWADRDATIHVAHMREVRHALNFVIEPGPGVGLRPFMLVARLADGTPLKRARISGRQRVSIDLPRETPRVYSVVLNAEEGGLVGNDDDRVLNFRVFPVTLEKSDDVFPLWAEPVSGFHALESADDRLFRWVKGDAEIALLHPRGPKLRLDVESGPGFESQPFTLVVRAADGSEIMSAEVGSLVTVEVPVEDSPRFDSITLHAEGGGALAPGDDRILNFRVFAHGAD